MLPQSRTRSIFSRVLPAVTSTRMAAIILSRPMESLGIDIGGTSVKLAALRDGQTLWTGQSPFYARPTTEELLGALRSAAGGRAVRATVAGLCVPGLLDKPTRTITLAVNVPGLVGVPLNELVERAFGRGAIGRIEIINDAVAAATDLVAVRGLRGRLLALAIGTGVGAAVLDDGVPLIVEGESPGHIGQLDVSVAGADVIGPDGGAGSLEGYLGAPVLRDRYGAEPLEKMCIDDPPLRALVRAIRVCHAIYRPQHVCLMGGIGTRLTRLLPAIRSAVDQNLTSVARRDWQLTLGDHDFHAALGAARLAR
jgi:predicted NBD/HSP70 family sugar kinase